MKTLSSIVVGIDFSECSRVALVHAMRIASWSRATLHPVHVVETNTFDYLGGDAAPGSLQAEIDAGLVEDARRRWSGFTAVTPGARDLPIDVVVGSRLAGIRQLLAQHRANLLVLGAFGDHKPNVGLGTVASGCIRGVAVDVLVVRDTHREPFHTVVVGVDFSDECRSAVESAALVASREGAKLIAVHVAPGESGTDSELRDPLESRLRSFVATSTGRWPGLNVECHVHPYSGHRSGILEFAALVNADVIVIGTKGRTNLRDVVLGSTAEKVLRDSVVAVWAAKPTPARSVPD